MFLIQVLRVIRAIKWISVTVITRTGMVAPHDKVCAAIVLANDGVPQRFTWPTKAHSQVEQAQSSGLFRVLFQHMFITAHTREVINITRLGHANHGVDQQVGFHFACRAKSQFLVATVQRITGLEGDYFAPAKFAKAATEFRGRITQQFKVVKSRWLDSVHFATHVDRARLVHQVAHGRVSFVICAENPLCFAFLVRLPDVRYVHGRDQHPFGVPQRDGIAC